MKKFMRIVLALAVVLIVNILPADAERGGHFGHRGGHAEFGVFVGPGWWGPYPYYPYYPYYSSPPVIIEQPSELYVQPTPQAEAPSYWYYCKELQGYYPYVDRCPNGWMRVVPPADPPE
jgi:hypothetical protein